MFHFRGANTKAQRTKGPIGGGMAVTASDQHARHNQPLFRNNDVFDALSPVAKTVKRYVVFYAVCL